MADRAVVCSSCNGPLTFHTSPVALHKPVRIDADHQETA